MIAHGPSHSLAMYDKEKLLFRDPSFEDLGDFSIEKVEHTVSDADMKSQRDINFRFVSHGEDHEELKEVVSEAEMHEVKKHSKK